MQYILTEEEFKVYQRCKKFIEGDYNIMLKVEKINKPISDLRKAWLEYCLGDTDKVPDTNR